MDLQKIEKFRLVENGVLDTQWKRSNDEKNPGGYAIQSIFSKIKSVKLKKICWIFLLRYLLIKSENIYWKVPNIIHLFFHNIFKNGQKRS